MNNNIKYQKVDTKWKELWEQTSGNKIENVNLVNYNKLLTKDNYFISFPRSGHHAMVTALLYYFNLNGLNYCESYNCCGTVPCSNNKKKDILFNKNHDFKLNIAIESKLFYLVGIRHPVDSIVSWYYLNCRTNNIVPNEEEFKKFFNEKLIFYINFINKWLLPKHKNVYIYEYNNFLNNSYQELNNIIDFFSYKNNISFRSYKFKNILKLKSIIKNIQKRPDLTKNYNMFNINQDKEIILSIKLCEKKLFEILGYEVKSDFWRL